MLLPTSSCSAPSWEIIEQPFPNLPALLLKLFELYVKARINDAEMSLSSHDA